MLPLKSILLSIFFIVCATNAGASASEEIFQINLPDGSVFIDALILKKENNSYQLRPFDVLEQLDYKVTEIEKNSYLIESFNTNSKAVKLSLASKNKKNFWLSIPEFEKTFNLKLKINSKMQSIELSSPELTENKKIARRTNIKIEKRVVSDQTLTWDKFVATPNTSLTVVQEANNQNEFSSMLDANLKGPFLYHDGHLQIHHENKGNEIQLTLSRKHPQSSDLLGFMKASAYEIGYVYFPSVDQITGQKLGHGFNITNISNEAEILFSEKKIQGQSRPEWQIYVYINDNLIATTSADSAGRYVIEEIPYYQGMNILRIEHQGPFGQSYNEEKIFDYDNSFKKTESIRYQIAAGQTVDSLSLYTLKIEKPISDWLSNGNALVYFKENDLTYLQEQIRFRFNRSSTDLQGNLLTRNNSKSFTISEKILFSKSYLKIDYLGFDSDFAISPGQQNEISKVKSQSQIETQFPILQSGATVFLKATEKKYFDQSQDTFISTRFFKSFLSSYLFYEHTQDIFDNPKTFEHNIEYGNLAGRYKYQINGKYDQSENKACSILVEKQVAPQFNLSATLGLNSDSKNNYFLSQANYDFTSLSTFLSYRRNQSQEWVIKLGLFTSGFSSAEDHKIRLTSKFRNTSGQALIQLYIDTNQNHQFDSFDQPLKKVIIKNLNSNETYTSNSNGQIYIENVESYKSQNFKILIESIPNIYLMPENENIDFMITSGTVQNINIPFLGRSEVQGQVTSKNHINTTVEAINIDTQEKRSVPVDEFGSYNIKNLNPGTYKITVILNQLKKLHLRPYPEFQTITLPAEGKFQGSVNFLVKD